MDAFPNTAPGRACAIAWAGPRTGGDADTLWAILEITDAGTEVVERIYPIYNQRERAWARPRDDDERSALLRILERLKERTRNHEP